MHFMIHHQQVCFMVIAFNKPYGVVSQFRPHPLHGSLADFGFPLGVYPVGRLDHDSEGLLILTDEKAVASALLSDSHPRKYLVQVEGIPDEKTLAKMSAGVRIGDYLTKPSRAHLLVPQPDINPRTPPIRFRKNIPTTWIELVLIEGKNRQVRRMTAAVGFPTLRLMKVGIGDFALESLESGNWITLTEVQMKALLRRH